MSAFPKKYRMPDGSIYVVTLEDVRRDYADTVRQFDDLTTEQQDQQIQDFDEKQALNWMADQWYGGEIRTWGKATGGIDQEFRNQALEKLKCSGDDDWASDFELEAT